MGYRAEFDFREVKCLINGEKRTFNLAVFSSPATGYRWGKLYTSSNQQVFIDTHIQFFKEVHGVYSTVVYDNMRNVIQKFVGKHEKELNEQLLKMSLFYGFEPVVTNPYSGNEKGHVGKSVQVIRDQAFTKIYEVSSMEHAQEYLDRALAKLNKGKEIATEKPQLKPMVSDYDSARVYNILCKFQNGTIN